ncbi:MAG: VWA domain-containing protein, partial [Ralstonia sp.]
GLTEDIREELKRKAAATVRGLPVEFDRVALVVDVSGSMFGSETQKRRPIAAALALRDTLCAAAREAIVLSSDGRLAPPYALAEPLGDTSLAAAVVRALKTNPDAVFVLTDGYENAPAGRTSEVVRLVRRLGHQTPIVQFSPVFAAESRGVRALDDTVPVMPVARPTALGLPLLKTMFDVDVERAVGALLQLAMRALALPSGSVNSDLEG